ncbi:response regulator receiver domain-containing protein [Sarocladium implicatum]|nr:response regulator receiver domain-containing protein [Sarocladium implicatum]
MVDIASRIRAKLSRRRHSSTAPSLASSRSVVDETSSVTSQSQGQSASQSFGRSCEGSSFGESATGKQGDLTVPSLGLPTHDASANGSRGNSTERTWTATHHDPEEGDDAHHRQQLSSTSQLPSSTLESAQASTSAPDSDAASARGTNSDSAYATGDTAVKPAVAPYSSVASSLVSAPVEPAAAASATSIPPSVASASSGTATPAGPIIADRRHLASSIVQGQPQPTSNLPSIHESSNPASPANNEQRSNDTVLDEDAGGDGDDENEDSDHPPPANDTLRTTGDDRSQHLLSAQPLLAPTTGPSGSAGQGSLRPKSLSRQQSLVSHREASLVTPQLLPQVPAMGDDGAPSDAPMVIRKIWVKRPGASATLVAIREDDLVDDVRDLILRKYANSLGRTFDSPDLTLRIHPRDLQQRDRVLGPEEHMGRTIDTFYPGGQTVNEALIIDIHGRTPRLSPRGAGLHPHYTDDGRPSEAGEGYFPPVNAIPSPRLAVNLPTTAPATSQRVPQSISVLESGYIAPVPSPGATGGRRSHRDRADRPRGARMHTTNSPGVQANGAPSAASAAPPAVHGMTRPSRSRTHSDSSDQPGHPPAPPPLPTSPGPDPAMAGTATPPRPQSPRPNKPRRQKKGQSEQQMSLQPAMQPAPFSGGVPPINVLIVEDNPINLRLLEAFVKRLKVRWQTAMNGRDAVKKWRSGGFHLVLMDIMLPVMNGLEATREIRRLERVNSIGVFSSSPGSVPDDPKGELAEQDRLENLTLFKSPVIVVALTASSLQSDRHEALAAGCNDFLTKPVNFPWLEQKVMEWGCMQALIDFDGWRKWKDFSQSTEDESGKKPTATKPKVKKNRSSLTSAA